MRKRDISAKINRGMTLVEIIIALAAGVMVAGIVLGIFISTTQVSEKSDSRIMLYSEARLIEQQISNILKKRIPDGEILKEGASGLSSFNQSSLRIFSSTPDLKNFTPALITIKTQNSPDGKSQRIVAVEESYDPETGKTSPITERDLGSQFDRVNAKIVFKYASDFNELEPNWTDSGSSGTAVKLVQYSITLVDNKKDYSPIIVTSASSF